MGKMGKGRRRRRRGRGRGIGKEETRRGTGTGWMRWGMGPSMYGCSFSGRVHIYGSNVHTTGQRKR